MDPVNQYNNLSKDINYTFILETEVKSNFNKPLKQQISFLPLKSGP